MHPDPDPAIQRGGHLAANVVHFARVLRRAGLPVGTDRPLLALQALQVAGIGSRDDLHDVLQACLIDRIEHRPLFEQAFRIFWRDPERLEEVLRLLLPRVPPAHTATQPPRKRSLDTNRRLSEALFTDKLAAREPAGRQQDRLAIDAHLSWSDRERLRKADFDSMTAAEWAEARRMLTMLEPSLARIVTRRDVPSMHGPRLDLRAFLRDSARHGGDAAILPRRVRRRRPEPLVVILDISGSMARYSRMFLHFMHALTSRPLGGGACVHAFVFGTRLTNITRQLRSRDPDEAIANVIGEVSDWSGGTRIGQCLRELNRSWARRLPLGSATVLFVTDGLEHADPELLASQAERLARSCRRILWLNPLLRYEAFEPKARGVRALLPHVDRLLPVHNIESLEQLSHILRPPDRRRPHGNER